jgi:hypothetical protein
MARYDVILTGINYKLDTHGSHASIEKQFIKNSNLYSPYTHLIVKEKIVNKNPLAREPNISV